MADVLCVTCAQVDGKTLCLLCTIKYKKDQFNKKKKSVTTTSVTSSSSKRPHYSSTHHLDTDYRWELLSLVGPCVCACMCVWVNQYSLCGNH